MFVKFLRRCQFLRMWTGVDFAECACSVIFGDRDEFISSLDVFGDRNADGRMIPTTTLDSKFGQTPKPIACGEQCSMT